MAKLGSVYISDTNINSVENRKTELTDSIDLMLEEGRCNEEVLVLMKEMLKDLIPVTSISDFAKELN